MMYHQERQMKVLEWPPQSPDLNIIENLWRDLRRTSWTNNFSKLEGFCQEEWGKIQKARIERLLVGYRKSLRVVIIARGGVTKYRLTGFYREPFPLFYYFESVKDVNKKVILLKMSCLTLYHLGVRFASIHQYIINKRLFDLGCLIFAFDCFIFTSIYL